MKYKSIQIEDPNKLVFTVFRDTTQFLLFII